MLALQSVLKRFGDLLQALAVFFIGIVGCDVCNNMVFDIDSHLRSVVELSGFTRFYTYPRIGIYRAVVGFIAGVFALFIFGTRTFGLVRAPLFITTFYLLKLSFARRYLSLTLVCFV